MPLTEPLRYDSPQDAIRRLYNTLVIYDGHPVFVTGIEGDLTAVAFQLDATDHPTIRFHTSDTLLDLESPKIGWANFPNPSYLLRNVHRQFAQGIDLRKLEVFSPGNSVLSRGIFFKRTSELMPIVDSILNNFPSVAVAAKAPRGLAFDRDWAFIPTQSKNLRTVYSDFRAVATFDVRTGVFSFAPHMLTKTRQMQLLEIFGKPKNSMEHFIVSTIEA